MTDTESQWPRVEALSTGPMVWAESPRWRAGELWVSDTQSSRLIVVGEDGTLRRALDLDSAVNGTGFLPNGDLVAARMHDQRIDRFDGQRWSPYADLAGIMTGKLGDLIVLPNGTVYVDEVQSHLEPGRLLKVDPDGTASVAADDLGFPNGMALTDDGRSLVVAETFAGRLSCFRLGPEGQLLDRRVHFDLERELGAEYRPDGIWACRDGSVWVAATTGQAVVRVHDGRVVERVDVDGFAIACCMSDDERSLYVSVATSLDPDVTVLDAVYEKRTSARVLHLRGRA